jgi:hypothetical protein
MDFLLVVIDNAFIFQPVVSSVSKLIPTNLFLGGCIVPNYILLSKSLEKYNNMGKTYVSIKKMIIAVFIVVFFAVSTVAIAVGSHNGNGANGTNGGSGV